MNDPGTIRALALLLPILLAAVWVLGAGLDRKKIVILVLGLTWQVSVLYLLNELAVHQGWWRFEVEGGVLGRVPFDLLLGWGILWTLLGLIPAFRIVPALVLALAFDLLFMPRMEPVLVLGERWWIGEALALAFVLLPFLLVARFVRDDSHLPARALFSGLCYGGVFFILAPTACIEVTGGSWAGLVASGFLPMLWRSFLAIFLLLGVSASREFLKRGDGTPLPFDPPRRLVTSGLYAYVANPMQISCFGAYVFLGLLLGNPWVACGSVVGLAWSLGLARLSEEADMRARFGSTFDRYRAEVRAWLPRSRPFVPESGAPEPTLYVAGGCSKCQAVRAFLEAREPRGLRLVDAERHPERDLMRLTYDPGDGSGDEEGVAAFFRATEHLRLEFALVSALVRTPGLLQLVQLIADAVGAGPMLVRREEDRGKGG